MRCALFALLCAAFAHAQHLVFTIMTAPDCPVLLSAPQQSSNFGFETVLFRNEAGKPLESAYLTVTFYGAKTRQWEQVVDSGHVYIALDPGESKRMDVFLGRMEALRQKAKSMGEDVVWAKLFVSAAEFADGSRWEMGKSPEGIPDKPERIPDK